MDTITNTEEDEVDEDAKREEEFQKMNDSVELIPPTKMRINF